MHTPKLRPAMHTPDLRSWLPATGALQFSAAGRALRRPWGLHSLRAVRRETWTALAAALLGMALLLGFQQVVSKSVVQIDRDRAATAMLDTQIWHCKRLNGSAERTQCLLDLRQVANR